MGHQCMHLIHPVSNDTAAATSPCLPSADTVRVTRSKAALLRPPTIAYFPQLVDLRVNISCWVSESRTQLYMGPLSAKGEPIS